MGSRLNGLSGSVPCLWRNLLVLKLFSPGPIQYMHALQWILTPPAPLVVAPNSGIERSYCIFLQGVMVKITV